MKLLKEDINRIGYEWIETENGHLLVLSKTRESGIEEILLRNILQEFGDYKIMEYPGCEEGVKRNVGYVTNLPFELYREAHALFLKEYQEHEGYK
jgi:hypothetical protein